jgi:glyoxylase-like metal-dependent hydrolase (beta-lactamase superfamily II)
MTARIEKIVTSGTFSLDGQDFAVDNNVWLVGDDREVIVIDAAHEAEAILAAVGDRRLSAIVSTHGHNDGGPGATGRSYSDYPTIIQSIEGVLMTLPPDTVVHTGHGEDTTIGAEAPRFRG